MMTEVPETVAGEGVNVMDEDEEDEELVLDEEDSFAVHLFRSSSKRFNISRQSSAFTLSIQLGFTRYASSISIVILTIDLRSSLELYSYTHTPIPYQTDIKRIRDGARQGTESESRARRVGVREGWQGRE